MTYDASPIPYDVNVERGPKAVAYDGSAVRNPEARQTLKTLRPVKTYDHSRQVSVLTIDTKGGLSFFTQQV